MLGAHTPSSVLPLSDFFGHTCVVGPFPSPSFSASLPDLSQLALPQTCAPVTFLLGDKAPA